MQPNLQEIADLITTTEEILKCKTIFCAVRAVSQMVHASYDLLTVSWYVILRRGSSKWLFGWRWQYLSCYSSKKFRCNFLGLFLYFASCIPVESNFIFLWVSNDGPYFPRVCLEHDFLLLSWTKMTFRDYPLSEEIRS